MRAQIVARLTAGGVSCDAVDVAPGVVADSDECFVCNSLIGVWPVRSIDGFAVKSVPGPLTAVLMEWTRGMGLGPM